MNRVLIRSMALVSMLVLAAAVSGTGCFLKSRPLEKPPIVLIVIDTLRADHVGSYGYARRTTPNLDVFATEAVRFTEAHAAASWTVPSMASMFTGVHPWRHDVQTAELTGERGVQTQAKLSPLFSTLAESLGEAGYATYGVSANLHMDAKYGMGQGFENYEVFRFSNRGKVNSQLKKWLMPLRKALRRGQPYFLFVHYFDPHHPYFPVKPYIENWRPGLDREETEKKIRDDFMTLMEKEYFRKHPAQMQLLRDLYDSEVAAVDASVGQLLKTLPGLEDAVVVITSDHGEAFGDHKNMLHGGDLFREVLRVPLLVRFPKNEYAGRTVTDLVSLMDLYPTLAALGGAETPPYLEGVGLRGFLDGERPTREELFALIKRDEAFHWEGVIGSRYKWFHNLSNDDQLLFDTTEDPLEKHNLAEALPAQVKAFADKWSARPNPEVLFPPGETGEEIDPELREQLRNLGYM
jgi:arylsulfatase A-like enzyme